MVKKKGSEENKSGTLILEDQAARIVVESGEEIGKEFLVQKSQVTVGRHMDNDICLSKDRTVSRFHGKIYFDSSEGKYFFEDLNSTNGTTIDNNWFKNEKAEIRHGDRIVLGRKIHESTILRFYTKKLGLKDWLLG
jgi:pSer/pThr/pTyr-binding forkhead associated (FHA) protein